MRYPLGNRARPLRLLALLLVALLGAAGLRAQGGGEAVVLRLDGAVTPATAGYVVRGIGEAAARGAALVILEMDTPGGLDTSMREIVRAVLDSPVPVAGYVAPQGARAASAGTFILYATHVAAMAPSTNLGAATPVALGGGEAEGASAGKAVNDAAAYLRGLAETRGRDAEWAEQAVREAASLTAAEAAARGVIDFVAGSREDLLARADGQVVEVTGERVALATAGLTVVEAEPGIATRVLAAITHPNVALLLMVIGFYGIVFELLAPGTVFPGVIGGISLLTGLYALSVLPVSIAGVALLLLGLALIVAEVFAPSFGVLGIGGAAAVVLGATLTFEGDVPGLELSWAVLAAVGAASLGLAAIAARMAVVSHKAKVATGREELIGAEVRVLSWDGAEGFVHVHGERWRARAPAPLAPGDRAAVAAIDGLTLELAPLT